LFIVSTALNHMELFETMWHGIACLCRKCR